MDDKPVDLRKTSASSNKESQLPCTEECQESGEDLSSTHKRSASYDEKIHQTVGQKPFRCDYCDKSYTHKRTMQVHTRLHTGKGLLLCQECGRKFTSTAILKIHRRRHTGEKPFKCDFCNKSFNNKSNMKQHERIHVGKPKESPF